MKRAIVEKIVSALEAKTHNEQMKYGGVKNDRDAALAQAGALKEQATTALSYSSAAPSAGALLAQQRFYDNMLSGTRKRMQAAADLEPALEARRKKLEAALQREIAAKSLLSSVQAEDRKRRLDAEEQARSMTRLSKKTRATSNANS